MKDHLVLQGIGHDSVTLYTSNAGLRLQDDISNWQTKTSDRNVHCHSLLDRRMDTA